MRNFFQNEIKYFYSIKKQKKVRILKVLLTSILSFLITFQNITFTIAADNSTEFSTNSNENLITNGDFELTEALTNSDKTAGFWTGENKSTDWTANTWSSNAKPNFNIVNSNSNNILEINSVADSTRGTLDSSFIQIDSNSKYIIQTKVKIDNNGGGNFGIDVEYYNNTTSSKLRYERPSELQVSSSNEWKILTKMIEPMSDVNYIKIKILAGATATLKNGANIQVESISLKKENNTSTSVESVTVSHNSIKDTVGKQYTLTANVQPDSVADKTVKWESSDTSIATVDTDGKVTLLKTGIANITAISNLDSNISDECKVEVIEVSEYDNLLINGDFEQLEIVTDSDKTAGFWTGESKATDWTASTWGSNNKPNFSIINENLNNVLKVDASSTGTRGIIQYKTVSVEGNTKYEIQAKVKTKNITSGNFGIRVKEDKLTSETQLTTTNTNKAETWKTVSEMITTSADTKTLEIKLYMGATAALNSGSEIWIDDVSLKKVPISSVESVDVSPKLIKDIEGKKYTLTASVQPDSAMDKSVTWQSNDISVATVNENGVVTLLKTGTAIITVTSNSNKDIKDTCNIEVVDSIEYDNLLVNGDFELTEAVEENSLWKSTTSPQNWKASSWKSSNWGDPEYYLENQNATNIVKIIVPDTPTRGTIVSSKIKVNPETNYEISMDMKGENITNNNFGIQIKQYKAEADKTTSEDVKVIGIKANTNGWDKLSGSIYTGKNTNYIEVVLIIGATNYLTGGTIYVDNMTLKEIVVPVESIEIEQNEIYDLINKTHQLSAKIIPANATNKNVIWESDNSNIATVDTSGKVTLVNLGITKIKAITQNGNKVAECDVIVSDNIEISNLELNPNQIDKLEIGDTVRLDPIVEPAGLKPKEFNWESDNTSVATVENGIVTAIAEGNTQIKATSHADNGGKVATTSVEVVAKTENLIDNGSFEIVNSKGIPEGYKIWIASGNPINQTVSDSSYRGNNSFYIEASNKARMALSMNEGIAVSSGTYRASVYVKNQNILSTYGIRMRVNMEKEDGSKEQIYSKSKNSDTNGWKELEFIFDTPNNVKTIQVELFFEDGIGKTWLDNLKLESWKNISKLELPASKEISLPDGAGQQKLELTVTPPDAPLHNLIWNTTDDKVVAVDNGGNIIPKKAGQATITVMTSDGKIKSECLITVTGKLPDNPITAINFDRNTLNLNVGRSEKIIATVLPENTTDAELVWESSNEAIATVVDGRVTAKSAGTVNISAKSANEISAVCDVNVSQTTTDEFNKLHMQWKSTLNTNDNINESKNSAQTLWNSMIKSNSRKYLWSDITDYSVGDNITNTLKRLKTMAVAAVFDSSSSLYQNQDLIDDIVNATVWIYDNVYNRDSLGNYVWYAWDIGIPRTTNDIFAMMYEYFTDEEANKIMSFIGNDIMKDPSIMESIGGGSKIATGANLMEQSKVALMPAIIFKNFEKITMCKEKAFEPLEYVSSGDGFYTDGSYIQHNTVPYTGSYGTVLLEGLADLVEIFADTSYIVNSEPLYESIKNSYVDFIYNGLFMDMLRGRAIARPNYDDHTNGHSAIMSITKIAKNLPEQQKNELLSICKYWILNDNCSLNIKTSYDWLINDNSIVAKAPEYKAKEYYNMDRSVYNRTNFAFAVSKSSKRISRYELTNGENQKGWYTGDGMTYLYTDDDVSQFDNIYWTTVDYNKLPGTTVDTRPRTTGDYQNGDAEGVALNTWSGGTTDGIYGVSGMNVLPANSTNKSDMHLNKSWFVFDDEIVALGSDITSSLSGYDVQTNIEQRKLNDSGNNKFVVDSEIQDNNLGFSKTYADSKWAYLEGNNPNIGIGYYFPNGENISVERKTQTGSFPEISTSETNDKVYTKNFLTIQKNHGNNPQKDRYAYVILPNKSQVSIESYVENPDIEILSHTDDVHAVKEKNLGILAVNFFEDGINKTDFVTSYNQASVLIKEKDENLDLYVSDPTLENSSSLVLEIEKNILNVTDKPANVSVYTSDNKTKITLDLGNVNKGQTFHIGFKLKPNDKPQKVTEINLDKYELVMEVGGTQKLIATVLPENAIDKSVVWKSSDENIASVDSDGNVKAIAEGKAIITVTSIDKNISAKCNIDVFSISSSEAELLDSIKTAKDALKNSDSSVEDLLREIVKISNAIKNYESQKSR